MQMRADLPDIHDRRGSQDGFTVIEVLVTLCVVALLGSAIYGGLSHLARMRTITQTITAEQELDASLDYLQGLIANSQNLPLLGQDGTRAPMIGNAKTLRFVAQARTASDRYVLRDVELFLRQENGALTLDERHSARRASGPQVEGQFPVISRVASFELSYLTVADGDEPIWQDHWDGSRMPKAIAIKMDIMRNNRTIAGKRSILLGP